MSALLILLASVLGSQPEAPRRLLWSDEFSGTSVDAAKWRVEDAALMNNQELQYYTPDAATVRNGVLTIRAEKRRYKDREYTAALLDTRDMFATAFGRIECRIKLPRGQGLWPAVWMLPAECRWPPEIDIMENLGHEPYRIHTTHHWGPPWPNNQKTTAYFDGPDYAAEFHLFAVEWTPDRLEWYIDGDLKFTSTENVPQDPFYLILNLAVGGSWGGNPDQTTTFPQDFDIDWVRVYEPVATGWHFLHVTSKHGTVRTASARWAFTTGERAVVTADPDIGYRFVRWTGDHTSDRNPLEIEISNSTRLDAVFERLPDAPSLLSRSRPVRASSFEGYGVEPERAVDASLWTRWSSQFSDDQWLEVDLGGPHTVQALRLMWDAPRAIAYSIEVSDDRAVWRTIHTNHAAPGGTEKITGLDDTARYVRFHGSKRSSDLGYSLYSFEVYGK